MDPTLNIGPAAIQSAALLFIIGFWLGLEISARTATRHGIPREFIDSTVWRALIVGLVVGRLVYVAYNLTAYINDPLGLISPMVSTINPLSGLAAAAGVTWLRARKFGIPLRPLLDALAPGIGIVLIAWVLGDLLNGDKVGRPADIPWAIKIWDQYRHPTQLYIALPTLAVTLWTLRPGRRAHAGYDFLMVMGVYNAAVLFSGYFRESGKTALEGIRSAQLAAWAILVAVSVVGWYWSVQANPGTGTRHSVEN